MLNFQGKRVLVMGLGRLGGGVATTKWLVKQGAEVTVTDLKTREELADSAQELERECGKDVIRFVLGEHKKEDFASADFIVVNPGVPRESEYLKDIPREKLLNDALVFFNTVENPIVAVTGTKGKTTTANWIGHFLRARWSDVQVAGNTPENPLLKELERIVSLRQAQGIKGGKAENTPVVVELSSWQLEFLDRAKRAPDIAVITNLYPDHMNRYSSMEEYALAKANIFKNQTEKQFLILNKENEWTKWFLGQKPISHIRYTSSSEISDGVQGEHNLQNLQAASLAAHLLGISWEELKKAIKFLPQIKYRQEKVLEKKNLSIINDSTATSPDATIAAIKRFASPNLILISGGTDKNLDYKQWATMVKKHITPNHLFLLEGSATKKMVAALKRKTRTFKTLRDILQAAKKEAQGLKEATILFSPSAASFEKFKNEFDRGERFNELAKKYLVV